ncbi:MAG: sigma-70 family RNA polymerase sigma factor [Bacteroidota bacterium]
MVDNHLIAACKRKERQAFQQCYEACAPYVFSIVKAYLPNASDRKDVMQEVFAQLFHHITAFDERKASFKTWMTRITINQTISFLKKHKKYSHLVPLTKEATTIPDDEKIEQLSINKQVLDSALQQMPVGYKTVFLLFFVEGYSHGEIAKILNITTKTSRSQLSRAIKWLRSNYQDQIKRLNYG